MLQSENINKTPVKKLLLLIAIVAFLLRAGYVLLHNPIPLPLNLELDEIDFDYLGQQVALGNGLTDKYGSPTTTRFLFYPLFLGIIYFIFGHHIIIAMLFQSALGALTPIIVYFIAREYFAEKVSLLSAGITVVFTEFIYFAGLMMSENLFMPLLALILLFTLRLWREFTFKNGIILGLLIAIASLTRGVVVPLMILLPLYFLTFARSGFFDRLKKCAVMGLVIVLTLTPWIIRNYIHYGKLFITSSAGGVVLWMCYRPIPVDQFYHIERAYAYVDSVGREQAKVEEFYRILVEDNLFGIKGAISAFREYYPNENFPDNDVEFNQTLLQKIKEERLLNPKTIAVKMIKDFLRFWHFFDGRGNYVLSYGLILPFFLYGLWRSRKRWREMKLLLAFFLYVWGMETFFSAGPRYRMPFEVVMIVVGAYGIVELFHRLKPLLIPIAVCAMILGTNLFLDANPLVLRNAIRTTMKSVGIPVVEKDSGYIPQLEKGEIQ